PGAVLAFALSGFVAGTVVLEFARGVRVRRAHGGEGPVRALAALVLQHRRRYGGYIVHLGILLLFCGVTGSSVFSTQRLVTLRPGEAVEVGEYRVRYDGLRQSTRSGTLVMTAALRAFSGGRPAPRSAWCPNGGRRASARSSPRAPGAPAACDGCGDGGPRRGGRRLGAGPAPRGCGARGRIGFPRGRAAGAAARRTGRR